MGKPHLDKEKIEHVVVTYIATRIVFDPRLRKTFERKCSDIAEPLYPFWLHFKELIEELLIIASCLESFDGDTKFLEILEALLEPSEEKKLEQLVQRSFDFAKYAIFKEAS
ncbi:hypothetical protein [Candidatus Liberibacter solanacearum]|nr:hypothetical protein [Candidatus Liberibacter solanacearum]